MIKEAIEKILELKKPTQIEVGGREFYDPSYRELKPEHEVESFEVSTLTGLVDYVISSFDTNRSLMIHIASPTKINLFDQLNSTNDRRTYLKAKALLPSITFNQHIDRELFQIMVQANFCSSPDKSTLLRIVSNMTIGEGASIKDNGATQEVTVKQGVELDTVELQERYTLLPYRTFVEIPQPSSDFILRVKEGGNKSVYCGLYEADGGAWELNAMHAIKDYLATQLSTEISEGRITIVS